MKTKKLPRQRLQCSSNKQYNIKFITIHEGTVSFLCSPAQTILSAIERQRYKTLLVGCREGGCGVCKAQLIRGSVHLKKMSRSHISKQEEEDGYVLTCCAYPRSDVLLQEIGLV